MAETKKKGTKTPKAKKQENEVLEAINKAEVVTDNVIKVPEEVPEQTKTDAETVIEEANEILDNKANLEEVLEEKTEEIEKTIEKEIEKTEKIIEKGKNVLENRGNNNYAFTEFWNGTTMY